MELLGQAHTEINKAKTLLGNRPEQANRMIEFLNRQELAAIGIPNRTEAVLTAKKVLTLRNYVQAVERKCNEITADVEEFRVKLAITNVELNSNSFISNLQSKLGDTNHVTQVNIIQVSC